ncbi:hypothetical protein PAXRUDRAFT_22731 [Paxillus rubicundulus Ve08.2h10]|uniref:Uncharacterized protein n=1 Tax=Paxillus rubicundulus Ve08.2h10 TaxID=930991 RepID=A0A0D0BJM8_9AGAM|nr:hypothetical protein PAXRUDRAFT_22731 [Paxillus rubicundulus Ve08.2h10]
MPGGSYPSVSYVQLIEKESEPKLDNANPYLAKPPNPGCHFPNLDVFNARNFILTSIGRGTTNISKREHNTGHGHLSSFHPADNYATMGPKAETSVGGQHTQSKTVTAGITPTRDVSTTNPLTSITSGTGPQPAPLLTPTLTAAVPPTYYIQHAPINMRQNLTPAPSRKLRN